MRTAVLMATLGLVGCDATFIDLREEAAAPQPPVPPEVPDPVGEAAVVASGAFEGRGGYRASGTAALVLRPDGAFEVRLAEDFSVSRVPGPVVVLSRREALGTGIRPEQGDVALGVQAAPGGAQRYPVPAGADDRRVVWIYCEPFGLEVGRAILSDR